MLSHSLPGWRVPTVPWPSPRQRERAPLHALESQALPLTWGLCSLPTMGPGTPPWPLSVGAGGVSDSPGQVDSREKGPGPAHALGAQASQLPLKRVGPRPCGVVVTAHAPPFPCCVTSGN